MYMRVKDLFLTRKLRDLRMIIVFIFFVQLVVSSTFKGYENKIPIRSHLRKICEFGFKLSECKEWLLNFNFVVKKYNAYSFAFGDQQCCIFSISKMEKIYLNADFTNSTLKDAQGWTTYVPKLKLPKDRVVFWPLTKDSQGKNFGTGGKALDLPIPKDRCEFVSDGPQPWISGGKVCKLGRVNEDAAPMVPIVQNGHRFIDFSKEFTFELWIKSHDVRAFQPIIATAPWAAVRFLFYPSYHSDQLALAFSEKRQSDYTTVDGTDRLAWRYLAVTYIPNNEIAFFRNAKKWPVIRKQMPWFAKIIPPTHITMFFLYGTFYNTYATLAMVGIHKRALSQGELKELMVGGSIN